VSLQSFHVTVFLRARGCMVDLSVISKSPTCKRRKRRFRTKLSKKFWNKIFPFLCYKRREKSESIAYSVLTGEVGVGGTLCNYEHGP